MNNLISFFVASLIVIAAAFGLFKLVGAGEFMDWLVGSLSIIWMLFVVTIPWNAYFKAREIIYEAEISKLKNISVSEEGLLFAEKVGRRSFFLSIGLHIVSALVLFWVAYSQISIVGYYSSLLILLLTFLRPGIRFYEYLQKKLEMIREEFHYPREDIELLKHKLEEAGYLLNPDLKSGSWKVAVDDQLVTMTSKLEHLENKLSDNSQLIKENKIALDKELNTQLESLRKENQDQISKIVEHGEVVESLAVIGKYLKKM